MSETTITKGGHALVVLERGLGRVLNADQRDRAWTLLPCKHRALVSSFTAPFRHHKCDECGSLYATDGRGWVRFEFTA